MSSFSKKHSRNSSFEKLALALPPFLPPPSLICQVLGQISLLQLELSLVDNLLDSARGEESKDEAGLLLTLSVNPRHRLMICGRVPICIYHYEAVRSNEIQAASAGLTAQEKCKAVVH